MSFGNICGGRIWVVVLALTLGGCGSPSDSGEAITRSAFTALKKKDWAAYKELTITPAAIALAADKISPFKRGQTYVGSSVKAEEEDRLKEVFDAYCQKDCLKDASIANVTQADSSQLKNPWSHSECILPLYRYRVGINGQLSESVCVVPEFVVTKWKDKFYLLSLQFSSAAK